MNAWQQAIAEQGLGLAEFARSEAGGSKVAPSQNQQVRMIAGRNHVGAGAEDPALLEIALEHLDRDFTAVGITTESAEFAAALAEREGWGDGIAVPSLNRNRRRPASRDIDPEDLAAVAEHNALDISLYETVAARIEEVGVPLV